MGKSIYSLKNPRVKRGTVKRTDSIKKTENKDNFLRNNAIFFLGSAIVAFLNYLYYPILGRLMTVEDFGEIQALISILLLLSIFLGVFSYIKINLISNKENNKENKETIIELEKTALIFSLTLFMILLVFSPALKSYFHFESFYPFIGLAFLLPLGVPFTFRNAFMQGNQQFSTISKAGTLVAGGRLILAILFVYLGFRTLGAITGLIIANAIAILYLSYKKEKKLKIFQPVYIKKKFFPNYASIKKELQYGLMILIVLTSAAFFYTADVIIVKHYLPPYEAGLYSGIATIARIIFFLTGSIAGVLLASVKLTSKNKKNKDLLIKSFLLMALLGGGCLAVFSLIPETVVNTLIGSKYISYSYLLPSLSLAVFIASIMHLLFMYNIALRRYAVSLIALPGVFLSIFLSSSNHSSPQAIINNFILSGSCVLALLFIILIIHERRSHAK